VGQTGQPVGVGIKVILFPVTVVLKSQTKSSSLVHMDESAVITSGHTTRGLLLNLWLLCQSQLCWSAVWVCAHPTWYLSFVIKLTVSSIEWAEGWSRDELE